MRRRKRFNHSTKNVIIFLTVLGALFFAAIFFTDDLRAATFQWITKSTSVIKPKSDAEKVTRLLLESSEIQEQINKAVAEKDNAAAILNAAIDCAFSKPIYDILSGMSDMFGSYGGKRVSCALLLPDLYRYGGGVTSKE